MIIFQVLLNFDLVKEILKIIRCHIYILIKKVIILRKIHVTMKFFYTTERNSAYSRFSCRFITYSIRIENPEWCKCRLCKNEAREIDCLCCREVHEMLNASTKTQESGESISPSSFYGHLPDYQSHVLALSNQQMSSSFCSWCN